MRRPDPTMSSERGDDERGAEQPELLGDDREDEVGLGEGDAHIATQPQPGADHAAVGHGEGGLHDLIALARRVGPGVEPDVDPVLHVGELLEAEPGAEREQRTADDQPAGSLGGHPEQHDEQGEEEQRRPEIALGDHHHERDAPRQQHRTEVFRIGELERADTAGARAQQLAFVDEVGGDEDRQHDLGDLTRLEVDRADLHPDACSVDGAADAGDEGQDQQHQADEQERVAIALEHPGATHDDQRGDERQHAHGGPRGLQAGQALVEAGDHDVAQAVQEGDQRQQDGIGVGGVAAHGEVGGEEQREQHDEERPDVDRDLGHRSQAGQHIGAGRDDHGQHDQPELGVAAVAHRGLAGAVTVTRR